MAAGSRFIGVFCLITLFGSYCRMAPAAGAGAPEDNSYSPGGSWRYRLLTTVLLNEPTPGKDVGYQITNDVQVDSVWKNPAQPLDRLLKIQLSSLQLYIKSRKAPAPEGFVLHSSKLEGLSNSPFLVHWRQGRIQSVYVPKSEPLSMINLKKGIASLFQYQLLDMETNETDSSGQCNVFYRSTGPTTFKKTKMTCLASGDTPYLLHPDPLFSVDVQSSRVASYEMEADNSHIKSVTMDESHVMTVIVRQEAGARVGTSQQLTFEGSASVTAVVGERLEDVVQQLSEQLSLTFSHESLMTERETKTCQDNECPGFGKLVADNLLNVANDNYGKIRAATGFIRTLQAARDASKNEISKVLKNKKYQSSLSAIYDILGSAQTMNAHEAAMKTLQLTDDSHLDNTERYFWALSMGSHPKLEIIKDLLEKYLRTSNLNEKVKETLILTIASMTNKYVKKNNNKSNKIYQFVKETIYNGIESCDKQNCLLYYIRALKNLKSEDTIPKLIELASRGDKSSVVAMKSLSSFPKTFWNAEVIKTAQQIFFQIEKKYDSSARTLSLDILVGSNPDEKLIEDLLHYLLSNDKSYEIKKYVIQKLIMKADKDSKFQQKLNRIIKKNPKINNYAVLAQRGMSSALSRQFLHHSVTNGSMISAQEMNSGLVKRGVFDIILENNERSCEMFSLGLFSGGLSSLISSDDADESAEDETATAGMEISLLGTQIRPFVFFSGQGELMGHVWSGTASESTPALQINTLIHDHLECLRLSPGFIAELSLQTAISFNLAGEIQISLWNRNSHSLVNQNAGIVMNGLLRVDTSFVQSQVEFTMSTEPQLDLESDIEFGSGVAVCLRLMQPSTIFKHNIFKIERIPGSKHKLRKAKYKRIEVPGRTYNLNRKNNEMCNILMQQR